MEHIIARQNSTAKPATGKTFLLGIARIIFELALAQLIVNFLIRVSGLGLLNILFYLYAMVVLVRFMMRTVAGCIYTLRSDVLFLQRMMGDSTVLGVEIPLDQIISIRRICCAERLHLDYRQVTYVDPACAPGLRMRTAFFLSLIWAWLARRVAGAKAYRENGYIVVYLEGGKRQVCAFKPDEAFLSALEKALPDVYGVDERLTRAQREDYAAKSLYRAFGDIYPHVASCISEEELSFEREEFALRREEKLKKSAKKKNIPLEQYKAQLAKKERKKAERKRRRREAMASIGEKLTFLAPLKERADKLFKAFLQDDVQEEQTEKNAQQPEHRRRSRQE